MLIIQYKFNKSTTANLLPVFDSEFEYTIEDSVDDTTVTRKIFSDYVPTRISFQAKKALLQVEYIDSSRLNTAYGMFYNCTNLTYVNMPFVTYVSTMEGMFNGCTKLQRIEGIEQWDTSRNSNWGSTFGNCRSLTNLDPRNFILTDAHAMGATFRGCIAAPIENFDFKNWRTPNVQYLSGTFDGVTTIKELDLSTFNVSNVGDIQGFLGGCSGLERVDLSNWILTEKHYNWQGDSDIYNPLKVTGFFKNCSSLVDIKLLNTNRFTAFKLCGELPSRTADNPSVIHITMEENLDNELAELIASKGWTVDYEQRPSESIITSYYFDPEIGNIMPVFNEGFEYTYEDSIGLNNNVLRTIKSSSLPTNMYFGTNHVSQDDADSLINVLEINTSNIEDLSYMFKGCRNIGLIPIGLVTSKATKLTSMFEGCSSLDINYMYRWYTENVVDMSYMFKDCTGMTSIGIEELKISKRTNIEGMFEGCINLKTVRATPEVFDKVASVLPDRPFDDPGQLTFREGTDNSGTEEELTCDDELLKHNWLTNRNRHLDLFVMMGQSNMQGQSEIYKEFEVPMYQSCTYLYNTDEIAQVKHPFGENIQTLGTIEELGYWQLEGAVGCETGLPYGSLSPHFAASYFEETHTPTLMVQCARGATTMKDWLPGTTQQRFEIAVEKTQKSIAAVEEIGRTIRGKYLVWLQGESDGVGTSVGSKKSTYKTRFLQFWNAIKAELGFEKCFIIRVHKFRDGYSYNCFPIIEAQEELSLENDDIELVTRITGYLEYYNDNPEHYTIQHAYQGLQIVSNHDHYTWEGYKLVGDTAGSRVGQYINTGIMPELEAEPWPEEVTASSEQIIAKYKFDNTITSDYKPIFNDEFTDYRVFDATEDNVISRRIISRSLPSSMKFNNENNTSLLEVHKLTTDNLTDMEDMFNSCSNLTYINLDGCKSDNVTTLERAFYSCTNLTTINGLNNLNTSNVNNIGAIFSDCSSITDIDVKDWNVSQITNFGAAFRRCPLLASIDLSNWNTENANIMSGMFTNCNSLTSIDVSNFKTDKATTINQMFYNCTNLTSIKLFNFIGDDVDTLYLFGKCSSLNEVVMRNSDHNSINKVIEALPTKAQDLYGELDILYASNLSQVDISIAKSKYWNLYVDHIYKVKVAQCNSIMIGNKKIKRSYIAGKKKI